MPSQAAFPHCKQGANLRPVFICNSGISNIFAWRRKVPGNALPSGFLTWCSALEGTADRRWWQNPLLHHPKAEVQCIFADQGVAVISAWSPPVIFSVSSIPQAWYVIIRIPSISVLQDLQTACQSFGHYGKWPTIHQTGYHPPFPVAKTQLFLVVSTASALLYYDKL